MGPFVEPDWTALWADLAVAFWRRVAGDNPGGADDWSERARHFDAAVKRRQGEPDPLRDHVLARLTQESTFLDIGAGTGSWTLPVARVARQVTAVEPSSSMLEVLKENVAAESLANVRFVQGRWEQVEIAPHDFALCSHAMYTSPDLIGFVSKMERAARQMCFLVMRVPAHDGVLAELNRAVRGHPYDSPNFVVGYNALLSAGFLPNVLVEPSLRPWANLTLDGAFDRAKRHLRLPDDTHDALIKETLARRLVYRDGHYYWPDGMRSALLWWEPRVRAE
ncbi:MAG: class I SAM-dependent methyltransferase [Bacteroidetes bacterium]|nr:class I SAM-dependent methyltransferase [Bacteroidota bacterium]MCL5026690.1 class I SAM-dependent methyltransferase [Chloroflexota bacterium]